MLTPEMIKYLDDADDWVKRFDDLAEPLMHLCSEIVEDLDGRDLD